RSASSFRNRRKVAMPIRKYILTLLLLVAASAAAVQNNNQTKFVTVCEVLGKRGSYNGKVVALIGRWSPTDEGFWLADDCEKPVKTGDYVWDNLIVLAHDPSSPSIFSNGPQLDRVALNKKIAELKSCSKPTNEKLAWA